MKFVPKNKACRKTNIFPKNKLFYSKQTRSQNEIYLKTKLSQKPKFRSKEVVWLKNRSLFSSMTKKCFCFATFQNILSRVYFSGEKNIAEVSLEFLDFQKI